MKTRKRKRVSPAKLVDALLASGPTSDTRLLVAHGGVEAEFNFMWSGEVGPDKGRTVQLGLNGPVDEWKPPKPRKFPKLHRLDDRCDPRTIREVARLLNTEVERQRIMYENAGGEVLRVMCLGTAQVLGHTIRSLRARASGIKNRKGARR